MNKKCSVCEEEVARYVIKDSNDYYCQECALDCFGDVSLLITVEEQAQRLKDKLNQAVLDQYKEVEEKVQEDRMLQEKAFLEDPENSIE